MGSVDHGKTTLLDYIRKTNVAAKEAGGITQSVGAYEIEHSSTGSGQTQHITFIDTPGHEAFSKIKARGAHIADIAILVVAADDGVQPQTKEALKIIKESQTPFIVAINKIDRIPDTTKVKNELMQTGVLLEGYGGSVSYQALSAKTGEGINDLLDLILLAADVERLDFDPNHHASGIVLESTMDSRRGVIATLIITDGTLKTGDTIATATAQGKVRILENFLGKKVDSLSPSSPAVVIGFETLPKAGDPFHIGGAEEIKPIPKKAMRAVMSKEAKESNVNLILKADVSGSLEALTQVIKAIPTKQGQTLEIIEESVGDITDGDVKLALSTKSLIIGFRVSATKAAETLARAQNVKIVQSEIIYDLVKVAEETLLSIGKTMARGKLEILATFGKKAGKQIIGGKVTEGIISNNAALDIERKASVVGKGKIVNLQQSKKDIKSVPVGSECGMIFDTETEIKVGDILIQR